MPASYGKNSRAFIFSLSTAKEINNCRLLSEDDHKIKVKLVIYFRHKNLFLLKIVFFFTLKWGRPRQARGFCLAWLGSNRRRNFVGLVWPGKKSLTLESRKKCRDYYFLCSNNTSPYWEKKLHLIKFEKLIPLLITLRTNWTYINILN